MEKGNFRENLKISFCETPSCGFALSKQGYVLHIQVIGIQKMVFHIHEYTKLSKPVPRGVIDATTNAAGFW
jgi:hypothetical protein